MKIAIGTTGMSDSNLIELLERDIDRLITHTTCKYKDIEIICGSEALDKLICAFRNCHREISDTSLKFNGIDVIADVKMYPREIIIKNKDDYFFIPPTSSFYNFDFLKTTASKPLIPIKVIFNPPATVVYWNDGTKTVVKATNESFDKEKGFAMAYLKKSLGNKGNYNKTLREWLGDEK